MPSESGSQPGVAPVLVGVGDITQRNEDPRSALNATDLMEVAVHRALADAGVAGSQLESIRLLVAVPDGSWVAVDPGRVLAERLGAITAVTLIAEIGVLQQDVIADGCAAIARGEFDAVVVVGGEARRRSQRALSAAIDDAEPSPIRTEGPDRRVQPAPGWIHDIELTRNLVTPAVAYAVIDSARRSAAHMSSEQRTIELGERYRDLSRIAAGLDSAWDRHPYRAEEITEASDDNRIIATPYMKRMCSQWNVDQAAALLLCSNELVDEWSIPKHRCVHSLGSVVSNHAVPVAQRRQLGSSPGAEIIARRLLDIAGIGPGELGPIDLYSCFPVAIDVLADAFGVGERRDRSVVGGMAAGGGPLNNFVLQALAELVRLLRQAPGTIGLSTSVSGFLTKVGAGLWSTTPSAEFVHLDVSAEVAHVDIPVAVDGSWAGPATIAGWTVEALRGVPHRAVIVADTPAGDRTLGSTGDASTCARLGTGAWLGSIVTIREDGSFVLD